MSQPRFLLVHGRVRAGVATPVWPTGEQPLSFAGRPDGAWTSWRLVGANNREIGRSAQIFDDESACLVAIFRVKHSIEATPAVLNTDGHWSWQLTQDGRVVAMAGRSYQRQRECRFSLAQFALALARARVPGPAEVQGKVDRQSEVAQVRISAPALPAVRRVRSAG